MEDCVLHVWSQFVLQVLPINLYFFFVDPVGEEAEVLFVLGEGDGFFNAVDLEVGVFFLFLGFPEEEVSDFSVELRHFLHWEEAVLGGNESQKDCVQQVLVLFFDHLVEDFGETGRGVLDFPHHYHELAQSRLLVEFVWQLCQILLKNLLGVLVD